MQGWKRALEPLNSFPFNFFCFARNSAKFPHSPPSLPLSLRPQPPTLRSIETSPPTPFPARTDGGRRTASCALGVYGALCKWKFGCSHLGGGGGKLLSDDPRPDSATLPPSLLPFLSAIKIALLDGPLYDPVFQNISVIGSGGSGRVGRQNERASERARVAKKFLLKRRRCLLRILGSPTLLFEKRIKFYDLPPTPLLLHHSHKSFSHDSVQFERRST